jgi:hypothetical protein
VHRNSMSGDIMFEILEEGMSYRVRTHDKIHTGIRHLTGETISEVVDKSIKLYVETWDRYPEFIEFELNH